MAKSYGSNVFINRVSELLSGKYDTELVALQSDSVTLQQIKIQSLILLEVLEELRKLNSAMLVVDTPKDNKVPLSGTGSPLVNPVSISSASDNTKRA